MENNSNQVKNKDYFSTVSFFDKIKTLQKHLTKLVIIEKQIELAENKELALLTTYPINAHVRDPIVGTLQAINGKEPYKFYCYNLPSGYSINVNTGEITKTQNKSLDVALKRILDIEVISGSQNARYNISLVVRDSYQIYPYTNNPPTITLTGGDTQNLYRVDTSNDYKRFWHLRLFKTYATQLIAHKLAIKDFKLFNANNENIITTPVMGYTHDASNKPVENALIEGTSTDDATISVFGELDKVGLFFAGDSNSDIVSFSYTNTDAPNINYDIPEEVVLSYIDFPVGTIVDITTLLQTSLFNTKQDVYTNNSFSLTPGEVLTHTLNTPVSSNVVNTTYTDPGFTATDFEDADLTSNVYTEGTIDVTTIGVYKRKYTVRDFSNNEVSVVRTVNVLPDISSTEAVVILNGNQTITVSINGNAYIELGASALDSIDGNISANITIDASQVDFNTPGTYQIIYGVINSRNNLTTTNRNIIVL